MKNKNSLKNFYSTGKKMLSDGIDMDEETFAKIDKKAKVDKILFSLNLKRIKYQRYLSRVMETMNNHPKDYEEILKDSCWVDGTLKAQIEYAKSKMINYSNAYDIIKKKNI